MGNARVHQQYVEALTSGSGNARVYQQYVEMLASASAEAQVHQIYVEVLTSIITGIEEEANNTITFSHALSTGHGRSITSTMILSHDVEVDHPLGQLPEHDLDLIQDVDLGIVRGRIVEQSITLSQSVNVSHSKIVEQTITFTHEAVGERSTSTSNTLTLTQDVVEEHYKYKRVFANLFLTQSVEVNNVINQDVSNTLTLSHEVKQIREEDVSNTLNLTQDVSVVAGKNIVHSLTLSQSVVLEKVFNRLVNQTFTPTHLVAIQRITNKRMFSNIIFTHGGRVIPIFNRSTDNTLNLTQQLWRDSFSEANSDFVSLDHEVTVQHIRNLSITHSLTLSQEASKASILNFNIQDTLTFPEYRTQRIRIGDVDEVTIRNVNYSLISGNDGTVNGRRQRATMTIKVPGRTVVLPVPLFGDGEGNTDSFTMSYAIDGTVYTTVRRSGTRVINFEWDLSYPKAEELKEFIWEHNSKAMVIENWKGEIWLVRLLTNPIDFVDQLRPSLCESDSQVMVTLEFEGVRVH